MTEAQQFEPVNQGIVLAVDHFTERSGHRFLLAEVLRSDNVVARTGEGKWIAPKNGEFPSDIGQHELVPLSGLINGLWVPRDVIDDPARADAVAHVALGVSTGEYVTTNEGMRKVKGKKLRLIYDTSSSGGIEAMYKDIGRIARQFPGPHMSFAVSLTAEEQGFEALQAEFGTREDMSLLLSTAYPEHTPEGIKRFHRMTDMEYTAHLSRLADESGFKGVVGYGGLAAYTRVGQYFCALGVCIGDAVSYTSRVGQSGYTYTKRMVSPEDTFMYARSTEVTVGRTLFQDEYGRYLFPHDPGVKSEEYASLPELITKNICMLKTRLDAIAEPQELPEEIQQMLRAA